MHVTLIHKNTVNFFDECKTSLAKVKTFWAEVYGLIMDVLYQIKLLTSAVIKAGVLLIHQQTSYNESFSMQTLVWPSYVCASEQIFNLYSSFCLVLVLSLFRIPPSALSRFSLPLSLLVCNFFSLSLPSPWFLKMSWETSLHPDIFQSSLSIARALCLSVLLFFSHLHLQNVSINLHLTEALDLNAVNPLFPLFPAVFYLLLILVSHNSPPSLRLNRKWRVSWVNPWQLILYLSNLSASFFSSHVPVCPFYSLTTSPSFFFPVSDSTTWIITFKLPQNQSRDLVSFSFSTHEKLVYLLANGGVSNLASMLAPPPITVNATRTVTIQNMHISTLDDSHPTIILSRLIQVYVAGAAVFSVNTSGPCLQPLLQAPPGGNWCVLQLTEKI